MHRSFIMAAAAGALAWSGAAMAQVPPEIAAKVRAAGEQFDPSIAPLYAPMFPEKAWAQVNVERGIAYGSAPSQGLDVTAPTDARGRLPVLLFAGGGDFSRAGRYGQFHPDNVALWAARNAMVGVNVSHRLPPNSRWPGGAQGLASALAWTRANIANYGGDPDRIILIGHSAGANHVADYVAQPDLQGAEARAVKGAVLLSPRYGAAPAYYGQDQQRKSAVLSVEELRSSAIPLFLADTEFDPQPYQAWSDHLRAELCKTANRCPQYVRLTDHNPTTAVLAIGTGDRSLTGPLLRWIRARR